MIYKIILQPGAVSDVEQIIGYLADRSLKRAAAWRNAWNDLLVELRRRPESFGRAPESDRYDDVIRLALFKTRRGRTYRALFVIADHTVHIIHVRGPGQDLLSPDQIVPPT
jgi:plasmid stabilization system protein ParE